MKVILILNLVTILFIDNVSEKLQDLEKFTQIKTLEFNEFFFKLKIESNTDDVIRIAIESTNIFRTQN